MKEKIAQEDGVDPDSVRKTLRALMDLATEKGWLKNERFEAVRRVARVPAG